MEDDVVLEATGPRLVLAGASFAEFRGDQICAFRHYFDDAALDRADAHEHLPIGADER